MPSPWANRREPGHGGAAPLYTCTALAYIALFVAVLWMGDVGRVPVVDVGPVPVGEQRTGSADAPSADTPSSDTPSADAPSADAPRGGNDSPTAPPWQLALRPARPDPAAPRSGRAAHAHLRLREHRRRRSGLHHRFVDLPARYIGIVFAANTRVIVISQLFVLSVVSGRSRARVLAGVGVMWSISWVHFRLRADHRRLPRSACSCWR